MSILLLPSHLYRPNNFPHDGLVVAVPAVHSSLNVAMFVLLNNKHQSVQNRHACRNTNPQAVEQSITF